MFKFKVLDHKMKFLNKNCFPRKKVSRICLIVERKFSVNHFEKSNKMEQEKSNKNSLKESNYNQNKFSIAEIPTFSQIKESGVQEKLGSGFTSIHVKRCAISPRQARFFLVILPRGS